MVAEVGGGGAGREPASRSRVKKAAAGRQADLGLEPCPPLRRGRRWKAVPGSYRRGGPGPAGADGEPVRDGDRTEGRGDGVVGPGRLEHEGFAGVGHQEGGVVGLPMGGVRDPPCPQDSSSPIITSMASAALRDRSKPSRTRSMPVRAGLARAASWVVPTRSLPMATPYSFTPCSAPQIQVGHESRTACAPVSPMVRYWVRSVHPFEERRPNGHVTCTSPGGRSEFLAKTVPAGLRAQSVSHIVAV